MPEVEIAKEYGLARGTVRQALLLLVNLGLLQRTRRKGTFIADSHTRSQAPLIGIIVPYLGDYLTTSIMHGAESVLRLNGYSLMFGPSGGQLDQEQEQIKRFQRDKVGGLILYPISVPGEARMLQETLTPGFPLVLVDRKVTGFAASSVFVDNGRAAYKVVEHLISVGHRRIACVTHDGYVSSVDERQRGYEQAMIAAGLAPSPLATLVRRGSTPDGQPAPYAEHDMGPVDQLFSSSDRPTALFCINDSIALGVMRHIVGCGLRVPDDVAIVGFDDIPVAAYMPVPLTTVAQPKFEIGSHAAQLLLDKISGREPATRTVVLPTALSLRLSTGRF